MYPFKPCTSMHTVFYRYAERQYWFTGIAPEKLPVAPHIVHVLDFLCHQRQKWDGCSRISQEQLQVPGFIHAGSPLIWRNKTA